MPKAIGGVLNVEENSPERCVMQVPPMRMSLGWWRMVVKVRVGGKDAHDFVLFVKYCLCRSYRNIYIFLLQMILDIHIFV